MVEKKIELNLKKQELKEFLKNIKMRSDSFSIARYYEGNIDKEAFQLMQEKFYNYILTQHTMRVENYLTNYEGYKDELDRIFHFDNEKQAMDYLDELFNKDMDVYQSCQYCEYDGFEEKKLNLSENLIIKREFTRMTPVTIGPVFEVITLSLDAFDEVTSKMKKLFSTCKIFGDEFEDICCYKDGNIILRICSHEGFAFIKEG